MEIRRIKDKYTQKENQEEMKREEKYAHIDRQRKEQLETEEIKENKKIMKDKNKLPKKYC